MGAPAHLHGYTFKEYLDLESASNVKHEFLDGEIYAMAGGSPRHAALTLAVGGALLAQLRGGPCRAFSSDLRIRVAETGLATYPDVTVVCGPLTADPDSEATVTNPKVIVEVLSPSTKDYDLGEKFEHYRKIPSLQAVLYVWQTETRIESRTRGADGSWASRESRAGGTVAIDAIGCALTVDDVYRDASPPG
ncbi:MAG TPA: Uma2 family endonuclease [Polyangia bacterium]|jgi:Uma2 family endonuclease